MKRCRSHVDDGRRGAAGSMRGVRRRACLLFGLALLVLTGAFFGSASSGALAQESFALTQGKVYWHSNPMYGEESHDIWWIFLDARLNITGSTVQGGGAVPYDFYLDESHFVGSGQWSATGTFDPTTGQLSGRLLYSSSYTYQDDIARWRISYDVDADFSAVATGPGDKVRLALSNGMSTFKMERWLASPGTWTTVEDVPRSPDSMVWGLEFTQEGGPNSGVPADKVLVTYAGGAWMSPDGDQNWVPLTDGALLEPGCKIRVPGPEDDVTGGQGTPPKGWRVILTFGKGFRCVVEPGSVIEVFDWGARVESGSIEMDDDPTRPSRAEAPMGMCSGKDPGATQPPLEAQSLGTAPVLTASAANTSRYRVEVLPDNSAKVSVLEGAAEVESATTHAKRLLRAGQQVAMTSQGLGPVSEKSFTDVTPTTPYRTAIIGMAVKEIVNGYKQGELWEFRPGDPVKRAQFAKMIVGAMSLPPKSTTTTRFTDLGAPDTAGYPHVFVQAAYESKITTGTNTAQTMFGPWDPIKRAQVVTMIVRAAKELWPGVLKTPPTGWSGAMSGFTDVNHGANMRMAEYNGLLAGLTGFGRDWNPWAQASRGEVAQMLWNLMTR